MQACHKPSKAVRVGVGTASERWRNLRAMLHLMACQMANLQLPPAYKPAAVTGKLSWSACKALRRREGMWLSFLLHLPRSCKMQVRVLEAVGVRSPSMFSHKGTRVQEPVLCQLYRYSLQSVAIVTHVLAQIMSQVSIWPTLTAKPSLPIVLSCVGCIQDISAQW